MSKEQKVKRKYTELTLESKVELIQYVQAGNSHRDAVKKFAVSKGTVSNILSEKDKWIALAAANSNPDRHRHMYVFCLCA